MDAVDNIDVYNTRIIVRFLSYYFTFGLAFSKYGKIKLGEGKPQYSTMSWIFMFILSGIGSSTLYWGSLIGRITTRRRV